MFVPPDVRTFQRQQRGESGAESLCQFGTFSSLSLFGI